MTTVAENPQQPMGTDQREPPRLYKERRRPRVQRLQDPRLHKVIIKNHSIFGPKRPGCLICTLGTAYGAPQGGIYAHTSANGLRRPLNCLRL
jgi:hypothetical protein